VFEGRDIDYLHKEVTLDDLVKAYKEEPDYSPCHNCMQYKREKWGTAWLKQVDVGEEGLTEIEAKRKLRKFFLSKPRKFRLSSYANGTLSVGVMKSKLAEWKKEGFVPGLIVVDYADIMVADAEVEFRHQQNYIWKSLRGISQEEDVLLITATQADAASYESNRLGRKNFSEDKRKYAHVTAMYGLNGDKFDREKAIGILRINELVKREGDFSVRNEVVVLQNLKRGRPFLTSYFK
jgi:hypothetical protein